VTVTPRRAAAALVATAAVYLIASLVTGRSARAEAPLDLAPRAADLGVDVWRAAYALVEADGLAAVVDVRPPDAFAAFHLPRAENVPGASAADVAVRAKGRSFVLVYASKDDVARKLAEDARREAPGAPIHFLVDGARAWYLALALPVTLFSEQPPPDGYTEAVDRVQRFLARPEPGAEAAVLESLQLLARTNHQPSLLKPTGPPKVTGTKKKIAGGCG
jgi:rhodanese-related sulfurtransferase